MFIPRLYEEELQASLTASSHPLSQPLYPWSPWGGRAENKRKNMQNFSLLQWTNYKQTSLICYFFCSFKLVFFVCAVYSQYKISSNLSHFNWETRLYIKILIMKPLCNQFQIFACHFLTKGNIKTVITTTTSTRLVPTWRKTTKR